MDTFTYAKFPRLQTGCAAEPFAPALAIILDKDAIFVVRPIPSSPLSVRKTIGIFRI